MGGAVSGPAITNLIKALEKGNEIMGLACLLEWDMGPILKPSLVLTFCKGAVQCWRCLCLVLIASLHATVLFVSMTHKQCILFKSNSSIFGLVANMIRKYEGQGGGEGPSIISSSLGDGHRPGMLSRGQER